MGDRTSYFFMLNSTDPDIRYCVLISLDERFDAHLAQAESLAALFVALNDEVRKLISLGIQCHYSIHLDYRLINSG